MRHVVVHGDGGTKSNHGGTWYRQATMALLSVCAALWSRSRGPWWKRSMQAGMGRKPVKVGAFLTVVIVPMTCARAMYVQGKEACHDLVTSIFHPAATLHVRPMTIF